MVVQQVETETLANFDLFATSSKSTAQTLVVLIPCHNQERFIGSVVLKAREHADRVIVVDKGSTDTTAAIARSAGATIVEGDKTSTDAAVMNVAFKQALEFDPKAVIIMDGDWQRMSEQLPMVSAPVLNGEADLVVGSRYVENTVDIPHKRVIGHWALNSVIDTLSEVSMMDSQSGFRAFSKQAAEKISTGGSVFTANSEQPSTANDHKLKVMEVPITVHNTEVPKRSIINHGTQAFNGVLKLVSQHRPLLFFGVPGLLSLLIGLVMGFAVMGTYQVEGSFPTLLTLGTALLLINGTVATFTGIILHTLRGYVIDYATR